jgi:hypothetical protein
MWIGVYEFQHCPDVPWRVVLNECIELAKEFGGTDGHKYVNAVLNGLAPALRAAEVEADKAAGKPAGRPRPGRRQELMKFPRAPSASSRLRDGSGQGRAGWPRSGRQRATPMIFLNIGEPDFTAPPLVQEAAERAIRDGATQYTQALGLAAARAHQRLVRQPLRRGRAGAPHRHHGRRLGRAAAGLPGTDRRGRRGADARPQLPLQPPLRERGRGQGGADPTTAAERFQLSAAKVRSGLGRAHARRDAGLALQPHGHLDCARRAAPHPRRGARAAA